MRDSTCPVPGRIASAEKSFSSRTRASCRQLPKHCKTPPVEGGLTRLRPKERDVSVALAPPRFLDSGQERRVIGICPRPAERLGSGGRRKRRCVSAATRLTTPSPSTSCRLNSAATARTNGSRSWTCNGPANVPTMSASWSKKRTRPAHLRVSCYPFPTGAICGTVAVFVWI
jgi:hypothetical protein